MDTPDTRGEIEDSLAHLIPRKPFPQYVDDTVFLEVKELLLKHPDKSTKSWSEKPRLYTLLRMLNYEDESQVFAKFDEEQVGDFCLPLPTATLVQLAKTIDIKVSHFRLTQLHILSKSDQMNEEKLLGPVHAHRYIEHGRSQFEEMGNIGKGGSAEVVRVRHKLSGKQFACKRILRANTVKDQRAQLIEFEQEVKVLQRISHRHCVSFVASFTDLTSFSLILNPVASDVLKSLLERQTRHQRLPDAEISTLRHSFACLSTAVAHLHQQRVRHKDIKPGNILLSQGRVLLCDFGISLDWSNSEHSTTEGTPHKFTSRYCAPEVNERDPRNTKSDIWSLGCVFLEIITVIKRYTIGEFNDFLLENNHGERISGLWGAPDALSAWIVKLRSKNNDSADDLPLEWITPMIRTEPKNRLKAADVVNMIHEQSTKHVPHPDLFIAPCCSRSNSATPHTPMLTDHEFGQDNGLGIKHASASPTHSPHLPDLNRSPSSKDEQRNHPRSRNGGSRQSGDRSVSPRTLPFQSPKDSMDTISFPIDSGYPLTNKQPQDILSRADSQHTSSISFPQATESIVPFSGRRSPVPPPAIFAVQCGCAPRPNEKHIFNAAFTSVDLDKTLTSHATNTIDAAIPTAESFPKCEIGENKVQLYETPPEDPDAVGSARIPMMWWVTRRLVISYLSGTPEMRRCSSIWLPLADIQFVTSGQEVTLRWSDCNQMTQGSSGNYNQHYDWLYNPKQPNNGLTLRFNELSDANRFIDCVRLPHEDGVIVSLGRRIDVSPTTKVNIFDVGRRGVRNYRVVVITHMKNYVLCSKLFTQWPEIDLSIHVQQSTNATGFAMTIECKNVSTPTYQSGVREPAVDYSRVARHNRSRLIKDGFMVSFPIGMAQELPVPPSGVIEMLLGLTGWTLRYFGVADEFKSKRKRFGSKKYGGADIMLWEKKMSPSSSFDLTSNPRRALQVTLRQHAEGAEFLWTSAAITPKSDMRFESGTDATITITNKSRGRLLDVSKMTAVLREVLSDSRKSHSRTSSETHEEISNLVLTFHDVRYRLAFLNIIEDFKCAAVATTPLTRVPTRITASMDSM